MGALLRTDELPRLDCVVKRMKREKAPVPEMAIPEVDLGGYDGLTPEAAGEVGR